MMFQDICKKHGISPSITRKLIYNYIESSLEHPTVDQIYRALKPELPTLSKTTVYNVLDLFLKNEIITVLTFSSGESRYELSHHKHSHFECTVCKKIYDIPYVKPMFDSDALDGFTIESDEVILRGICKECMKH